MGDATVFDRVVDDVGDHPAQGEPVTQHDRVARNAVLPTLHRRPRPAPAGRRPRCAPAPRIPPSPATAPPAPARLDSSASSSRRIMSSISAMARCCSAGSGICSTRSRSRVANVRTSWAMPPIRVMRARSISLSRSCSRLNAEMTARISGALRRACGSNGGRAGQIDLVNGGGEPGQRPGLALHDQKRQQRHDGSEQPCAETDRQAERRDRQAGLGVDDQRLAGAQPDPEFERVAAQQPRQPGNLGLGDVAPAAATIDSAPGERRRIGLAQCRPCAPAPWS